LYNALSKRVTHQPHHGACRFEANSSFLADLNNVRADKNEQYRTNVMSLRSMMLLHSTKDQIINPPSSGWFQSFLPFTGMSTLVLGPLLSWSTYEMRALYLTSD
jgi:hypothetical protein